LILKFTILQSRSLLQSLSLIGFSQGIRYSRGQSARRRQSLDRSGGAVKNLNNDRERLSQANRVSDLHCHTARETGSNNILRNIAGSIGSRAIFLRGIFPPENAPETEDYSSMDSALETGGWSGECSGMDICVVSMTEDKSVTATFSPKLFNVNNG